LSLFLCSNNLDKSRCSDISPPKFFLFSMLSTLIFPPKNRCCIQHLLFISVASIVWWCGDAIGCFFPCSYHTTFFTLRIRTMCDHQGIMVFRCPKYFSIWHPFLSFLSTLCTLVSYGWQRLVACSIFSFHQSFWKTFCSSFICHPSLYLTKKICVRMV